jgi:hypothetical protein
MPQESGMNALNNANIQNSENSTGLTSFAFPEAKSSQTGVSVEYVPSPEKQWFVFRILYGHAQQVSDLLVEEKVYTYLAMIWKNRYKDGKRRRVLVPFLNLLFAYVSREQAEAYVHNHPASRYITYYYNHFQTNEFGMNPPVTVAERDMVPLIRATALHNEHVREVDMQKCRFVSGDLVRVTSGPFEGITGRVARINRQNRVVFYIEGLQTGLATAYIPAHCLEKVDAAAQK